MIRVRIAKSKSATRKGGPPPVDTRTPSGKTLPY